MFLGSQIARILSRGRGYPLKGFLQFNLRFTNAIVFLKSKYFKKDQRLGWFLFNTLAESIQQMCPIIKIIGYKT